VPAEREHERQQKQDEPIPFELPGGRLTRPLRLRRRPRRRPLLVSSIILSGRTLHWAAIAFFAIVAVVPYTGLYQPMTVLSGSMKPAFSAGDLVLVREKPTRDLQVGDVVVYRIPTGDRHVEAHRITRILDRHPFTFRSKGDANPVEDPWTAVVSTPTIAHVVTVVPYAGWLVSALRQPIPRLLLVYLLPLLMAAAALWAVWRARDDEPRHDVPSPSPPTKRRRINRSSTIRIAALTLAGLLASAAAATVTGSTSAAQTVSTSSCFYKPTVQSGSTTNAANGTTTVTISSVDPTKAFLLFNLRSNSNRPVASEVGGRIASATSLEFIRVTDEATPATITIQWYVIEYNCGVKVQRGTVAQSSTSTDVAITAVASTAQAFVTWSKTAASADTSWADNDPVLGDLTATNNVQFRVDTATSAHTIYWQVVEFTDSSMISVQRGTTSLASGTSSTTATLGSAVATSRTFVLVGTRSFGNGTDIGSGLVRGRLTSSTQVTLDRSATSYAVDEIGWQAIELKDGSKVQSGSLNLASGTASGTASLTAVDASRATAFAAGQTGGGQNGGRTSYTADDILGVGTATLAVTSSTQLTVTRANTSAAADIPWFVVEWGRPTSTSDAR